MRLTSAEKESWKRLENWHLFSDLREVVKSAAASGVQPECQTHYEAAEEP